MPAPPDAPVAAHSLDLRIVRSFFRLVSGFWAGATRLRAWALTGGLLAFLTLSLGATLALNHWNRWFFDALERKDADTIVQAVLALGLIIGSMSAIGVGIVRTRETLQVRWREWVSEHLVARWLGGRRYYHLEHEPTSPANPEYRISDDTRWATEILVDFAIGLFSALIGAVTFIGILWSVGGTLRTSIGGIAVTIPAYMVLAALAYGAIASTLMLVVGRPLVSSVVAKNEAEGHFRFAMMRVRDNAESVALVGGERAEHGRIRGIYQILVARWLRIVRQHGNLTWITNASGPLIPIVPLLFACPKYLAGELTLGQVVQLAAAFQQVQAAISWIVDNYSRIADWYASARRIMELTDACDGVDRQLAATGSGGLRIEPGAKGEFRLSGLSILDRDVAGAGPAVDLAVRPGEHLLVSGGSGTGKSTLVRTLSGLRPWARGTVHVPQGSRILVSPQKPYLPSGTLRHALLYPGADRSIRDEAVCRALVDTGLAALTSRLDVDERWDRLLSNGELQRLMIARILIQKPELAILDEAMTALDEAVQRSLLGLIAERLPGTAVIVLTQRPVIAGAAARKLDLGLATGAGLHPALA
jgi:putative ATP-binding cassette transporter